jgi:hypothetical protein
MESPSGNPLSTYSFWLGASLTGSVVLVKLVPHYSINESYPWTAVILFLTQWIVYGFYAVVVYPRFISPLRHLPQPKVCFVEFHMEPDMLILSGELVLQWTMGRNSQRAFGFASETMGQ